MDDWHINEAVGILGATSLVGECLLRRLKQHAIPVAAYTRRSVTSVEDGIQWHQLTSTGSSAHATQTACHKIPLWICAAPIWILAEYFDFLLAHGVRQIVVLSSTSRFTKYESTDVNDQAVARRLADAENHLRLWAEAHQVAWVILRPTLIYGLGRDKNISEIARFIRRFGFFPVFGSAKGLRQPLHVDDLAEACLSALGSTETKNRSYDVSGGEILTYRDMVRRIFVELDRTPRLITIPLWMFSVGIYLLRRLPRYKKWSTGMAERMNQDMVFEYSDAVRDFGFSPRKFLN
jgi:nucleoside-diphosphate-sugar epimerase